MRSKALVPRAANDNARVVVEGFRRWLPHPFTEAVVRAVTDCCRGLREHGDKPPTAALLRRWVLPVRRALRPLWPAGPEYAIVSFAEIAESLDGILLDYPERLPRAHRAALRRRYGVDPDAALRGLSRYLSSVDASR